MGLCRSLVSIALSTALVASAPKPVLGADLVVFGPETFRGTGRPVVVQRTFRIATAGTYQLRIANDGVSAAVIALNGRIVLWPWDFLTDAKPDASRDPADWLREWTRIQREWEANRVQRTRASIEKAVTLRTGANELVVAYLARQGTSFSLQIVRPGLTDTAPPTITARVDPAANSAGWHRTPATVTFTCADTGSGVATCPVPVTLSAEGAGQVVRGTAVDQAGNTATTSVTLNVDFTPPVVSGTATPPANAGGWRNTPVDVTFTATDPLSGVASGSLTPTVTLSGEGMNLAATGQARDLADNVGTTAVGGIAIDRTAPTISVSLSGPGADGVATGPVTAHFTCSDALSGIATCPPDQVVSTVGANQSVSGTAVDVAGLSASVTSPPFTIVGPRPPTISVALSPEANANGWNRTPVNAHFTCSDPVSGVATCPADQSVATEGANQTVSGTTTNGAGLSASVTSAPFNIDLTPPVVSLSYPTSGTTGTTVYTPSVTLSGTVSDGLSGIETVTCNGLLGVVTGGALTCVVSLTPGPNTVTAVATDRAGHTATASLAFVYVRVPILTIAAPSHLSYLNITPTTVTGTVDDPTATVTINSIAAPVVGGQFSIALPLAEGPNLITATATTAAGATGTASLTATLDTTPPRVTITSPNDGFVTADASISIAGNINDIVVGTVNEEQAQVTVNGLPAQVANRTFLASSVPLVLGPNVVRAVGRDRVGNSTTTEITVTRETVDRARIQTVSGNNQTAGIGVAVPAPLVIALTDAAGAPLPNRPVIFKVTQNDGLVTGSAAAAATVISTTDAQGRASVAWTLGHRAGAGGNVVEAYSVGIDGTAIFTATGTLGTPGKIVVDTGNDQVGPIGQTLPKPFIAVVVDEGNNRLGRVPVTFTVQEGGGSFDGQPSLTVTTDPDGRAAATLTLGQQEGNANNIVSATFPSNQGFPAAFTASGRAPGDPARTKISGGILDNSNQPVPGVTVRAVLTNVLRSNAGAVQVAAMVQTDAQGQFTIASAPVGFVKLLLDGSTVQRPGSWPPLEYDMVTVAGQTNTVGQPIYLLPLDTANRLCVTETTGGGTLTIPEAPGFSLTFGPGQVTFPGGSKTGCISVTVVHGDKVPMVPGFGQQPRFIVTIQPAGAIFSPAAPITLPNVDGLPPRAVTEMYSYDHDIASFVAIGTGTVSDDGTVVRSSPGVGVLKAGWHCGGDPAVRGYVADCPDCQFCEGPTPGLLSCIPNPGAVGRSCTIPGRPCALAVCGGTLGTGSNPNLPTGVCAELGPDPAKEGTTCAPNSTCQSGDCQSCPTPVNMTVRSVAKLDNGTMQFEYLIESNTGNVQDLSACYFQEVLSPNPFQWPLPFTGGFSGSYSAPITNLPALGASYLLFTDRHVRPDTTTPYVALPGVTINQQYVVRCPCRNRGNSFLLLNVGPITRSVTFINGQWVYTVTKSGTSHSIVLP